MEFLNKCYLVPLLHKTAELGKTSIEIVFPLNYFVMHVTNINYILFSPNWTQIIITRIVMVGAKCDTEIVTIPSNLSFFV